MKFNVLGVPVSQSYKMSEVKYGNMRNRMIFFFFFLITLSKDLQPWCPIFSCREIKEQRWMLVRPDRDICRGYQHTHIATNFLCNGGDLCRIYCSICCLFNM